MRFKAKLGLVAASVLAGGMLVRAACNGVSTTDGSDVLAGRVWLDHLPTKPDEACDIFVALAVDSDKGQGVFSRSSQFEGAFSVFDWKEPKAGVLDLTLLQAKTKHQLKYQAKKCDRDGFDFCLELEGAPKGPRQYVSKRGWELGAESAAELDAELDAWRRATLPAP